MIWLTRFLLPRSLEISRSNFSFLPLAKPSNPIKKKKKKTDVTDSIGHVIGRVKATFRQEGNLPTIRKVLILSNIIEFFFFLLLLFSINDLRSTILEYPRSKNLFLLIYILFLPSQSSRKKNYILLHPRIPSLFLTKLRHNSFIIPNIQ